MLIDFESFETNVSPASFSVARTGRGDAAEWVVREDASAPSGAKVLIQTSSDNTSYRFPLCVYDGLNGVDVTISVKFKAISGSVDQAAGIVWRYRDPNNYYVVRANALEDNVVLYKVEQGKRADLKPTDSNWLFTYGKDVEVAGGQWNQLQVMARGPRFSVFFNGQHVLDVEDHTFLSPGRVGLWTKADSVTAFDDLLVHTVENR